LLKKWASPYADIAIFAGVQDAAASLPAFLSSMGSAFTEIEGKLLTPNGSQGFLLGQVNMLTNAICLPTDDGRHSAYGGTQPDHEIASMHRCF
jgi:hypothetical protein